MSSPRLSFVVPVYRPNLELLGKVVKALCNQSLKSWEAVFVLDGEDEAAAQVIRLGMKKKANRYKIVEIEHAGVQRARNEGFKHTQGEFVVFWDSDCLIEPEVSQTWVDQFDANPDIAMVYSGYKFIDSDWALPSEPFDPYTLRVRNYISTCFPVRRSFYPGWNESLKSLQDWDFWLSVVEKGGKGKFLQGYAFSTALPKEGSISGEGCRPEVWLERMDAVKKAHNLPDRKVCVAAPGRKHEGIWLAKLLDADYQDVPNDKPHRYETIIQLGFSFLPGRVETHCGIFRDDGVKKVVFFTCDDIAEVTNRLNLNAVWKYSAILNNTAKLYVEDKSAYDTMRRAGFNVEIMPLPMEAGEPPAAPESVRVAVDVDPNYNPVFNILQRSLPDVELVPLTGAHKIGDFTGLVHFHPDRSVSHSMKRAALAGRFVVSNVQAPFMGYVDDSQDLSVFIPKAVDKIRQMAYAGPVPSARDYYVKLVSPEKLKEAI